VTDVLKKVAIGLGALSVLGLTSPAQAAMPTVRMVEAPLISPDQISSLYGSATTHTAGPTAWTTTAPDMAATARALGAQRVGAANGGLTADQYADRVAAYVRNNIAIEFRFGLGKGGRGALIDQSGTPFDQADLMVQLLREGGLASSYKFGVITLDARQFGLWSGLVKGLNPAAQTFTVDGKAACQLLANGGIPATVNGQNDCAQVSGDLSSVTLAHIWVQVNGKLYDPAYKTHRLSNPVDLASLAGCGGGLSACGSSVTMAALTNAQSDLTSSVAYIQNVNAASVTTTMDNFAKNIEAGLRTTYSDRTYREVIGEKGVDTSYAPVAGAALPYPSSASYDWSCAGPSVLCGVPDQYRSKVTIGAHGQDSVLFADELAGRHVLLGYGLSADSIGIISYSCQTCGVFETKKVEHPTANTTYTTTLSSLYLHIAVDHPYAALSGQYGDEDNSLIVYNTQATTPIIVSMGDSSASTQGFFNDLEAQYNSQFQGTSSPSSLTPVGRVGQVLYQQAQVEHAVGGLFAAPITRHHTLGVINQGTINAVNAVSIVSATSDATARAAAFQTTEVLASVFEGTVDNISMRLSAPSLFATLNEKGDRFLSFAHGNVAAGLAQLSNYDTGNKNRIQAGAAEGYDFIVPQNAFPGCFSMQANADRTDLSGTECALITAVPSLASMDGRVSYLTDNQVKAQSVNQPGQAPTVKPADYSLKQKQYYDVDLARGALNLHPAPDLVTGAGDFPYSLSFTRTYDSSVETRENRSNPPQGYDVHSYSSLATQYVSTSNWDGVGFGPYLGGGWTHNYLIQATIGPGAGGAFGQDSPLQASTLLASAAAIQGLYQDATFERRLSAMFVADWAIDHLVDNTVTLTMGPKTLAFTRLPSGVWLPPTGTQGQMTVSGTRNVRMMTVDGGFKKYLYRNLQIDYYDAGGSRLTLTRPAPFTTNNIPRTTGNAARASSWTFPDGVAVSFAYNDQNLTKVSNNLGRSLTFTSRGPQDGTMYEDPILKTVTDDNGRSVSYALSNCTAPRSLACNTFKVTLPGGDIETYSYAADAVSPDPAKLVRSNYRLRRWYTPGDQTNAFRTVVYDSLYRVASITDPLAHTTQYFVTSLGNDYSKTAEQLDPDYSSTTFRFDEFGSLVESVDALTRKTLKSYDAARRVIRTTAPEGDYVTYGYDVRSNQTSEVHHPKVGFVTPDISTSATYGEAGKVTCDYPASCNKPRETFDALNNKTTYEWNDTTGQLTVVKGPLLGVLQPRVDFGYSSLAASGGGTVSLLTSKVEQVDDGASRKTTYAYDAANHQVLSSITADDGRLNLRSCFKYDPTGNLIGMTDPRATVCP